MNRRILSIFSARLLLFVPGMAISSSDVRTLQSSAQEGTMKALAAIVGAGALEDEDYEYLRELSDDIGARVTGSPGADKAIAWAIEKMEAIDLENVHTEAWQLFRGWTRISANAELLSPVHRRLTIDSMGWADQRHRAVWKRKLWQ